MNPLLNAEQRLLGAINAVDIDLSILVDPRQHFQYQRLLAQTGEVELPNGINITRLVMFDHDYEWHMLAQVWDHNADNPYWRCVLLFGDSGGVELVYEWADWTYGKAPIMEAAEYVTAWLASLA